MNFPSNSKIRQDDVDAETIAAVGEAYSKKAPICSEAITAAAHSAQTLTASSSPLNASAGALHHVNLVRGWTRDLTKGTGSHLPLPPTEFRALRVGPKWHVYLELFYDENNKKFTDIRFAITELEPANATDCEAVGTTYLGQRASLLQIGRLLVETYGSDYHTIFWNAERFWGTFCESICLEKEQIQFPNSVPREKLIAISIRWNERPSRKKVRQALKESSVSIEANLEQGLRAQSDMLIHKRYAAAQEVGRIKWGIKGPRGCLAITLAYVIWWARNKYPHQKEH
ncbi:hypothetical protein DFJ77DRAFT_27523 [Powellomyces hirtus]|nr:hypothetical protein DFJ77DRAFT_27523 [Powellomyces hirtus]